MARSAEDPPMASVICCARRPAVVEVLIWLGPTPAVAAAKIEAAAPRWFALLPRSA